VSSDNGVTWSPPVRLFSQVGSNGPASFVIDGSNNLHMFFGNRDDTLHEHGIWHSIWLGEGWSTPMAVVSGPQVLGGENGEEGFDPSFVQAVISQGNLLLLTWRQDPMAGPTHIWFSYRYLDVPSETSQLDQSPETELTPTPDELEPQSPLSIENGEYDRTQDVRRTFSTGVILMLGLAPVFLVVVFLAARRWLRQ
jgi:hypothetical protein